MRNYKQLTEHFSQNSVKGKRKKNTPQYTSAIAEAQITFALQISTLQVRSDTLESSLSSEFLYGRKELSMQQSRSICTLMSAHILSKYCFKLFY